MNFFAFEFENAAFMIFCSLINVMFLGVAYFVALVAMAIVLAPLPPWQLAVYSRRLGRLALFFIVLAFVGGFFDFFWSEFIWDRFYYSTDYCGIDFKPFLPITQSIIDAPFGDEHGHLMDLTLFQLNLIWSVFALGTWGTTVAVYRRIRRKSDNATGITPSNASTPLGSLS